MICSRPIYHWFTEGFDAPDPEGRQGAAATSWCELVGCRSASAGAANVCSPARQIRDGLGSKAALGIETRYSKDGFPMYSDCSKFRRGLRLLHIFGLCIRSRSRTAEALQRRGSEWRTLIKAGRSHRRDVGACIITSYFNDVRTTSWSSSFLCLSPVCTR